MKNKRKSFNYFKKDHVSGKMKKEKDSLPDNREEITEVDDKLIGDDLIFKKAQPDNLTMETVPEIKNNNY